MSASTRQSRESALARVVLRLEAHAGPHVGRDEVGAAARVHRIGERREARGLAGPTRAPGRSRSRAASTRARRSPRIGCRLQPRVADVVGVADPRDGACRDRAAMLDVRVDVGQDLARVVFVGEAVDHRHARMRGEALDDRLLERADHHDVDHPRDHARDVLDRLAARELRVAAIQVDRDAAQLVHPGLERHARARRRLLEHHRERAVAQRLVELVALEPLLDPARAREQVVELVEREVAELEEMLGRRSGHGGAAPRHAAESCRIKILARDRARTTVARGAHVPGSEPRGGGDRGSTTRPRGVRSGRARAVDMPSRHAASRSRSTAASVSSSACDELADAVARGCGRAASPCRAPCRRARSRAPTAADVRAGGSGIGDVADRRGDAESSALVDDRLARRWHP